MNVEVGRCAACGAPMFAPAAWSGIQPPPITHSCKCAATFERVTKSLRERIVTRRGGGAADGGGAHAGPGRHRGAGAVHRGARAQYIGVRGQGAALRATGRVQHPGSRSMEFGRQMYYRGYHGRNVKSGRPFRVAHGQAARPYLGVVKGGGASGDVAPFARRHILEAIDQEWDRIGAGGT